MTPQERLADLRALLVRAAETKDRADSVRLLSRATQVIDYWNRDLTNNFLDSVETEPFSWRSISEILDEALDTDK
jgi:hypothetical protein